jgi:hypothetical protein
MLSLLHIDCGQFFVWRRSVPLENLVEGKTCNIRPKKHLSMARQHEDEKNYWLETDTTQGQRYLLQGSSMDGRLPLRVLVAHTDFACHSKHLEVSLMVTPLISLLSSGCLHFFVASQ